MSTPEIIEQQQRLLAAHRVTLAHFLLQRAKLGADYVPPGVTSGITEARTQIAQLKAVLRGWGMEVEEEFGDVEAPPPYQPTTLTVASAAVSTDAPIRTLRDPVPDFVGRERELALLVQALKRAAAHGTIAAISGVRGMGGVGKTELAYAVAQRLAPHFLNGQVQVDLQGAGAPLPSALALQIIMRALHPGADFPHDLAQLQSVYRQTLVGKRVLILADNAWDAAQVRPLLPPAGSALLITSRQRFTLPGMAAVDLRNLPEDEAIQLLQTICPRIGTHAANLAALCGYLPLALRVSASLLLNDDTLRIERYLDRLADVRTRLAGLRDPDDPDLDVEASLQLSYAALDPAAQNTLCQLSVFSANFTLAAAEAIVAGDAVEASLSQLRRRSMVDWDETADRYSLHDLVQVFAATRLGDQEAVMQRYLGWSTQETYQHWEAATDQEARACLGLRYQADVEQLWHFLADDLRVLARRWMRSELAPNVEALAMLLFTHIITALPNLQINLHQNIRHLLLIVAKRGLFNEYRQLHPDAEHPNDQLDTLIVPRVWDPYTHLVDSITQRQILPPVREFWRTTLFAEEREIIRMYWLMDPPLSFTSIAQQLGADWTAAAVEVQYEGIMQRTRQYLHEKGLLDDN